VIRIVICSICILFSQVVHTQNFELSPGVRQAYTQIINLQLDQAQLDIDSLKQTEPENLLVYQIENYIDFFRIFISEDKALFERLEKNRSLRLDKIKTGDDRSPYYRFAQAEIYLQWVLARSKFYDGKGIPDLKLITDLNKAYRLLEDNKKRFPDFVENYKSLSILHALGSYVPGFVQKLLNVNGSLQLGLDEIRTLIAEKENTDYLFLQEAKAIEAYMLLHLFNQPEDAWTALQSADLHPDDSPLACFLLSSIAMKIGYTDYALELLKNKPTGEGRDTFHYLSYLEGKALLQKGDEKARVAMHDFVDRFNGRHFIKDAYQKLAWYELITTENIAGYKKYMALVEDKGIAVLEDDEQALVEAKSAVVPHPMLLQGRLLFDGGYYQLALEYLIEKQIYFEDDGRFKQEFTYRLGRIYQKLNEDKEAVYHFKSCLSFQKERNTFFSCNAALQLGLIFEKLADYPRAEVYFKSCRSIKSTVYRDQLHKKAKAGLERISIGMNQ